MFHLLFNLTFYYWEDLTSKLYIAEYLIQKEIIYFVHFFITSFASDGFHPCAEINFVGVNCLQLLPDLLT